MSFLEESSERYGIEGPEPSWKEDFFNRLKELEISDSVQTRRLIRELANKGVRFFTEHDFPLRDDPKYKNADLTQPSFSIGTELDIFLNPEKIPPESLEFFAEHEAAEKVLAYKHIQEQTQNFIDLVQAGQFGQLRDSLNSEWSRAHREALEYEYRRAAEDDRLQAHHEIALRVVRDVFSEKEKMESRGNLDAGKMWNEFRIRERIEAFERVKQEYDKASS